MRKLTDTYKQLEGLSSSVGENNDCAVKALALVTGVDYLTAHSKLSDLGRKKGAPTKNAHLRQAVKDLGFTLKPVHRHQIISQYPGNHKNKKNITTHHPARFPAPWRGKTFMAFTKGHVLAIVDGKVHDWTSLKSLYIISLYEVTK